MLIYSSDLNVFVIDTSGLLTKLDCFIMKFEKLSYITSKIEKNMLELEFICKHSSDMLI